MSQSGRLVLRRALLYVPGSSRKMLEKSAGLDVDCVAYDLEDSVTQGKKDEARTNVCSFLRHPREPATREVAVRINSLGSPWATTDLAEILQVGHVDTIIVPKVNSASELRIVTDTLRHLLPLRHPDNSDSSTQDHPPVKILALIESAKALLNLESICKASPYLSGLIFAAEDFALDLSLTRTPSLTEFLYARSAIVTACRAHKLSSAIDLVSTSYRDESSQRILEDECLSGKTLGFDGKQCIHPSQVEIIQKSFTPRKSEVLWATKILIANGRAILQGRGAWTFEGKMIDAPVIEKATAIVRKAEACGYDIAAIKQKCSGQEPE